MIMWCEVLHDGLDKTIWFADNTMWNHLLEEVVWL